MAVCLILLPLATSFGHFILFSAIYGVFDGAFNGYILPIIATTVSSNQIGVALGALYTFISVELLLGAPIAGKIEIVTTLIGHIFAQQRKFRGFREFCPNSRNKIRAKFLEIVNSRNFLKIVPSRKLILAKFFVFDFFFLSKTYNKIRKKNTVFYFKNYSNLAIDMVTGASFSSSLFRCLF